MIELHRKLNIRRAASCFQLGYVARKLEQQVLLAFSLCTWAKLLYFHKYKRSFQLASNWQFSFVIMLIQIHFSQVDQIIAYL